MWRTATDKSARLIASRRTAGYVETPLGQDTHLDNSLRPRVMEANPLLSDPLRARLPVARVPLSGPAVVVAFPAAAVSVAAAVAVAIAVVRVPVPAPPQQEDEPLVGLDERVLRQEVVLVVVVGALYRAGRRGRGPPAAVPAEDAAVGPRLGLGVGAVAQVPVEGLVLDGVGLGPAGLQNPLCSMDKETGQLRFDFSCVRSGEHS